MGMEGRTGKWRKEGRRGMREGRAGGSERRGEGKKGWGRRGKREINGGKGR
jgi:hypothetical protein